ncbi:cytochrome c maturation protein CcmE [Thiomicrorhabdus sp. Kp2]|uniref:cytochrome c maturation protein CcmE n=1 Tax=Thiomicrorhabdus sp. Kp2 TaxID=1123518 RepID=UPI0005930600|nr:cytochrome c maturation protein CcmE [Thiomicrorhabdus sp. Kp2]
MSPVRKKRLYMVLLLVLGVSIATALIVQAFSQNMMFFFSTSEVKQGKAPLDRDFRLGGLVVNNSVIREPKSLTVRFQLTDTLNNIEVKYTGILPDLFREGQGIIAKGHLNPQGAFIASEVLAKHDENYMPPEVADSLAKAQEKEIADSLATEKGVIE